MRLADELGAAARHDPAPVPGSSNAGMAAAFIAMNEVFGPLFNVSRGRSRDPGRRRRARRRPRRSVHLRLPDALRARRLRAGRRSRVSRSSRSSTGIPALENEIDLDSLQVRELPEGDLRRQRHQGRAAVRFAGRRSLQPVPDQRPDRRGAHGGQPCRGLASHARALDHPAEEPTAGWTKSIAHRNAAPGQLEGLHHRRSDLPDEEGLATGGSTTRSSSTRSTRRSLKPASTPSASTRA